MNKKRYATAQEANDFFKGFLDSLSILIDEKSQNDAWVNDNYTDYHLDFVDVYEAVMSPCEVIITWKSLPKNCREQLKVLYNMIYNYNNFKIIDGKKVSKTNKEIALDPEWHKIRSLAKKIYNDLISA